MSMSGCDSATLECPNCGAQYWADGALDLRSQVRPWHVIHGANAVKQYIASLGEETHEWLLALYVDDDLQLLSVETIARGGISNCPVPKWHLISRAKALQAAGFILVHNHPSGDLQPSRADILVTQSVAMIAREFDAPLLDHFIIAGDKMLSLIGCLHPNYWLPKVRDAKANQVWW